MKTISFSSSAPSSFTIICKILPSVTRDLTIHQIFVSATASPLFPCLSISISGRVRAFPMYGLCARRKSNLIGFVHITADFSAIFLYEYWRHWFQTISKNVNCHLNLWQISIYCSDCRDHRTIKAVCTYTYIYTQLFQKPGIYYSTHYQRHIFNFFFFFFLDEWELNLLKLELIFYIYIWAY